MAPGAAADEDETARQRWYLVVSFNGDDRGGMRYHDAFQVPVTAVPIQAVPADGSTNVERILPLPDGAALVEIYDGPELPAATCTAMEGALHVVGNDEDTDCIVFTSDAAAEKAVSEGMSDCAFVYTWAELTAPLRDGGVTDIRCI